MRVEKKEVRFLDESDRNVSLIKTWDDVTSLSLFGAHVASEIRLRQCEKFFPGFRMHRPIKFVIRFFDGIGIVVKRCNVLRDSKKREKKSCINTVEEKNRNGESSRVPVHFYSVAKSLKEGKVYRLWLRFL